MRELIEASEAIRPTPPEAFECLTQDQIDAIHISSVEKEKARTSDDQLWSKLLDVYNREVRVKSKIAIYCKKAYSSIDSEQNYWQSAWERLCSELKDTDDYIKLIAWHLTLRGQTLEVAKFLNERAEYEKENRLNWVNATEKSGAPTLHLVRE
jgi:hypothetical protein